MIDVEAVVSLFLDLLRQHGAPILFLAAMVESLPALGVLPGEVVVMAAGFLVQQEQMRADVALLSVFAGAVLGDIVVYLAGRYAGAGLMDRLPSWEAVARAERLVTRYGGPLVMAGHFSRGRGLLFLALGARRLPFRRFAVWELAGAAAWAVWRLGLGAVGGAAFDTLTREPSVTAQWILGVSAAIGLLAWCYRHRIKRLVVPRDEPQAA